jgi:fatty acid desaturase
MTLGQVFSEYFGFAWQSFHRPLHTHHHQSEISLTPPQEEGPTALSIKIQPVVSEIQEALIKVFICLCLSWIYKPPIAQQTPPPVRTVK